ADRIQRDLRAEHVDVGRAKIDLNGRAALRRLNTHHTKHWRRIARRVDQCQSWHGELLAACKLNSTGADFHGKRDFSDKCRSKYTIRARQGALHHADRHDMAVALFEAVDRYGARKRSV